MRRGGWPVAWMRRKNKAMDGWMDGRMTELEAAEAFKF